MMRITIQLLVSPIVFVFIHVFLIYRFLLFWLFFPSLLPSPLILLQLMDVQLRHTGINQHMVVMVTNNPNITVRFLTLLNLQIFAHQPLPSRVPQLSCLSSLSCPTHYVTMLPELCVPNPLILFLTKCVPTVMPLRVYKPMGKP